MPLWDCPPSRGNLRRLSASRMLETLHSNPPAICLSVFYLLSVRLLKKSYSDWRSTQEPTIYSLSSNMEKSRLPTPKLSCCREPPWQHEQKATHGCCLPRHPGGGRPCLIRRFGQKIIPTPFPRLIRQNIQIVPLSRTDIHAYPKRCAQNFLVPGTGKFERDSISL